MLDYVRNSQDWNHTNSSITSQTHKIFVWKTTSTAVYFHILVDDSTPKHIFLKYSTNANKDLIKQTQTDSCNRTTFKNSSVNSSSVILHKDDINLIYNTADNKYKFFRSWTISKNVPGFFGFMEHVLKKQYYDNNGNVISTPAAVTTTYTIKVVAEPDQPSTDFTNATVYPNAYYCLVNSYNTQLIDILRVGDTTASNLLCKLVTDNTGVTVGSETFARSELTYP